MTDVSLSDGRLMSSRASRTAAIIEAGITSVDAEPVLDPVLLLVGVRPLHLAHAGIMNEYKAKFALNTREFGGAIAALKGVSKALDREVL